MRLDNKVAIVTGAASGIGKEIAALFAREGARVVIADLNQKGADAVAAELGGSKRAIGVGVDVTSEAQTEACVAKTVEAFGQVDILISNAGIKTVAPLDQFDFGKWKQLISIHLDGAFLTTRAALRQMYKRGKGGSIIYMGSVHSKEASVLKAPYVTAKHGLIGLAKVVAKEGAAHGCAPTSSVQASCARRSSTSRSPSRQRSSASPNRRWSRPSCSRTRSTANSPRSMTWRRPRCFWRPFLRTRLPANRSW